MFYKQYPFHFFVFRLMSYLTVSYSLLSVSLSFALDSLQEKTLGIYQQQIQDSASTSTCSKYSWKNRGRAPSGYIQGLALSFARSYCRLRSSGNILSPAVAMSRANTHDANKDALEWYNSVYSSLKIETDTDGPEALRAIYTLGTGLGMRESSGTYCEGWDTSAGSDRPSSAAEAGLFQTSYDSIGASSELKKLYDEYQAHPERCYLNVFKQGVSCKTRSILGTGAGAAYQEFTKSCPAFASEYAMVLLRVLRKHFGPIIRREAEIISSCNQLYVDVQRYIEQDPKNACKDLL